MILKTDNCSFELEYCEKLDDAGFVKYKASLSSYYYDFSIDSLVWLNRNDMYNFAKFFRTLTKENGYSTCKQEDWSFFPLEMGFRIIYPSKWNLLKKQRASTCIMLSCLISCVDGAERGHIGISDWFLIESIDQFTSDIEKELLQRYPVC